MAPAISHGAPPSHASSSNTSTPCTGRTRLDKQHTYFHTGSLLRHHRTSTRTHRNPLLRGKAVAWMQKTSDSSDGGQLLNGFNTRDPRVALAIAIGGQLACQAEKGEPAFVFILLPDTILVRISRKLVQHLLLMHSTANPVHFRSCLLFSIRWCDQNCALM